MAEPTVGQTPQPEEIDIGTLDLGPEPIQLGAGRRIEHTRAMLAYCLVGILAVVLVMMLVMVWVGAMSTEGLQQAATAFVGPLVALVGAATGYYYGSRGDR